MADVKVLGAFVEGEEVRIDGVLYRVSDIREDTNGNLQITFDRPVVRRVNN